MNEHVGQMQILQCTTIPVDTDLILLTLPHFHHELQYKELFSLPARLGGMGLINPSTLSQSEFHSSSLISQPLVSSILSHNYDYNEETLTEQQTSIKEVVKMKLNRHNTAATQLRAMLPSNLQLAMDLCQEK